MVFKSLRNILFAGLLAGCSSGLESRLTQTGLNNLHNSNQVLVTTEYIPEGSKYHLVHLRQIHLIDGKYEKDLSEDFVVGLYKLVNDVQRDIYFFLKEFNQKGIVDEVWSEGVTRPIFDFELKEDRCERIYYVALKSLYSQGFLKKEIDSRDKEKWRYIPGGELLLCKEKKIKILPGEDYYLLEIALMSREVNSRVNDNVFDKREDYLIEKIVEHDKPYGFFVFGASHNFFDNVLKWNSAHQDKKVSLTELTPCSYIKFFNFPK